jgi:hypothetical protein
MHFLEKYSSFLKAIFEDQLDFSSTKLFYMFIQYKVDKM